MYIEVYITEISTAFAHWINNSPFRCLYCLIIRRAISSDNAAVF